MAIWVRQNTKCSFSKMTLSCLMNPSWRGGGWGDLPRCEGPSGGCVPRAPWGGVTAVTVSETTAEGVGSADRRHVNTSATRQRHVSDMSMTHQLLLLFLCCRTRSTHVYIKQCRKTNIKHEKELVIDVTMTRQVNDWSMTGQWLINDTSATC